MGKIIARIYRITAKYPKPVTLFKQVIAKMTTNKSCVAGNQNIA
jgi:hypothetical protein